MDGSQQSSRDDQNSNTTNWITKPIEIAISKYLPGLRTIDKPNPEAFFSNSDRNYAIYTYVAEVYLLSSYLAYMYCQQFNLAEKDGSGNRNGVGKSRYYWSSWEAINICKDAMEVFRFSRIPLFFSRQKFNVELCDNASKIIPLLSALDDVLSPLRFKDEYETAKEIGGIGRSGHSIEWKVNAFHHKFWRLMNEFNEFHKEIKLGYILIEINVLQNIYDVLKNRSKLHDIAIDIVKDTDFSILDDTPKRSRLIITPHLEELFGENANFRKYASRVKNKRKKYYSMLVTIPSWEIASIGIKNQRQTLREDLMNIARHACSNPADLLEDIIVEENGDGYMLSFENYYNAKVWASAIRMTSKTYYVECLWRTPIFRTAMFWYFVRPLKILFEATFKPRRKTYL